LQSALLLVLELERQQWGTHFTYRSLCLRPDRGTEIFSILLFLHKKLHF
jgi:hypothetical protein